MICAVLTRFKDGFIFTASGHAGYDEPGRDVICAAVSMLSLTVAERLGERSDIRSNAIVESGSAHIEATGNVDEIYSLLRCGLRLLKEGDRDENWLKVGFVDRTNNV